MEDNESYDNYHEEKNISMLNENIKNEINSNTIEDQIGQNF